MQEDTSVSPERPEEILILSPAQSGENVRVRGEDVKAGATLVEAGETLTAGRIGLLASAGLREVGVARQPVAGLLATGSELKEPGQALGPGQIYESNRAALAVLAEEAGAVPRLFPLVTDSLAVTQERLREALSECDLVVSSGGVSVGEMDFIKRAFAEIGGEVEYWKVAIKPGRPFVFGRWREKLFFGLPGNPISALVTFLLLVRPALRRWQGGANVSLEARAGVLAEPLANPGERRHFMRVKVDEAQRVFSAGLQASHALSSAAVANGLVDVPPQTVLKTGTAVQVMRWE
jgi:molybdopterin molybdotransferase